MGPQGYIGSRKQKLNGCFPVHPPFLNQSPKPPNSVVAEAEAQTLKPANGSKPLFVSAGSMRTRPKPQTISHYTPKPLHPQTSTTPKPRNPTTSINPQTLNPYNLLLHPGLFVNPITS